jgi:hypothetical protein
MLISTALLLDSIIRNSVCTPAKLPCRRVEVGYEIPVVNNEQPSPSNERFSLILLVNVDRRFSIFIATVEK